MLYNSPGAVLKLKIHFKQIIKPVSVVQCAQIECVFFLSDLIKISFRKTQVPFPRMQCYKQ